MTKESFLTEYEKRLTESYQWAADAAKLARYMASVRATLGGANSWNAAGDILAAAWRAIGGKGKPSLKALRALA